MENQHFTALTEEELLQCDGGGLVLAGLVVAGVGICGVAVGVVVVVGTVHVLRRFGA